MKKTIIAMLLFSLTACQATQNNVLFQTRAHSQKHAKGLKKTKESKEKMKAIRRVSHALKSDLIPGAMDLSNLSSPIEDQGNCGDCWAFSLTKALRSEFMILGQDPGQLEFNYLLNNCGPGPKMDGCEGGDFTAASSFLMSSGPGLNKLNPYTAEEGLCKNLPVEATAVGFNLLGEDGKPPTFKDIAYTVGVERHVLSVDVAAASGSWENYVSGIYDGCTGSADDVDHMVLVTGFSMESSVDKNGNALFDSTGKPIYGDGYLIVSNQWGTTWGVNGTMKTRMYDSKGNHCNAIATEALFFEVQIVGCKK
jgi:C1A family cysteine protease